MGQTVSLIQETTLCALQGKKVVEFYFKKTEGTLRQAFGTLMRSRVPETKGVKKKRPAINRLSAVLCTRSGCCTQQTKYTQMKLSARKSEVAKMVH